MGEKAVHLVPREADAEVGSLRSSARSPETADIEDKYGHVERRYHGYYFRPQSYI